MCSVSVASRSAYYPTDAVDCVCRFCMRLVQARLWTSTRSNDQARVMHAASLGCEVRMLRAQPLPTITRITHNLCHTVNANCPDVLIKY